MPYVVQGQLKDATRVHTLGFHSHTEDNPANPPIKYACTDTAGRFSVVLQGPKNYRVSVNKECWAAPDPPIDPPGGGLLPVPVPNPPGANLKLGSPCTNAHPCTPPCVEQP